MKPTKFYLLLFCFLLSCSYFENKEKKAIEICQKAKIQLDGSNILAELYLKNQGITWLDYANKDISKNPNDKYQWKAEKTLENNVYVVAFVNQEYWGRRWEVNIEENTVKYINGNEYLSRKHGLTRNGGTSDFEVTDIVKSGLKNDNRFSNLFDKGGADIIYEIKASVLNKTNKTIVDAKINGSLKLIFKDKVIEGDGNFSSGFEQNISENNPWESNTKRDFIIYTKGIKNIYLSYEPEYIVFDISLLAKDPVGYQFDKDIVDKDLKEEWNLLKGTQVNPAPKIDDNIEPNNTPSTSTVDSSTSVTNSTIGLYLVNASSTNKVYFHNSPDRSTKRKAYIDSPENVVVKKIENGFGYVEFTNDNGQTTVGWLDMTYLIKKPN